MISVAALLGIQVLIIENVANLDEDEAFKKGLHDRLRSNGYSCILRHQFNTTKFRPVHRNRVILIAYFEGPLIGQLEDWKLTPVVESSPHIRCQDPFLMQLPGDLMHDAVTELFDLAEYDVFQGPILRDLGTMMDATPVNAVARMISAICNFEPGKVTNTCQQEPSWQATQSSTVFQESYLGRLFVILAFFGICTHLRLLSILA